METQDKGRAPRSLVTRAIGPGEKAEPRLVSLHLQETGGSNNHNRHLRIIKPYIYIYNLEVLIDE